MLFMKTVFLNLKKIRMKEHQKVRIQILPDDDWKERFDKALKSIRSKAAQFTQEEIERDIEEAIKEVKESKQAKAEVKVQEAKNVTGY